MYKVDVKFKQILAKLAVARVEVYLHQAAIHLGVASSETPAAKERADRHLGRLFVLAPFPFDAPLKSSTHPTADAICNTFAQLGSRMSLGWREVELARSTLL